MVSTRLHREPSLLKAARTGHARLAAAFGGQGSNNVYCLEELIRLSKVHGEFVNNLFQRASYTLEQLATSRQAHGYHDEYGFDLAEWLLDPSSAPEQEYLAFAPISFPLNTLVSLANYCITCQRLQSTPGQVRDALKVVVGHSQGLLAAAVVAKSNSWNDFYEATELAIRIAFFVGLESHLACPAAKVTAVQRKESIDLGDGEPSPMLSVSGLSETEMAGILRRVNKQLFQHNVTASLALRNSRDKHIIAGPAHALRAVCAHIRQIRAPNGFDQSRIPFVKRKPNIDAAFMPISAPFHSSYLECVDTLVMAAMPSACLRNEDFAVPFLHPGSGANFQTMESENLVPTIVRAVTVDQVAWDSISRGLEATHLLDFGPGRIGELTHATTEGTGLYVVNMSDLSPSVSGIGRQTEFFSSEIPLEPPNWKLDFGPGLMRDDSGTLHLQTKMTKLFGTAPVMVPGMVPTTVKPDLVAKLMQSGHHAELAGGGYSKEPDFEKAVRTLASSIPPHRGVTCNLLYANPQTIAWQTAMLRRLNKDGVPISGLTIGAGVPSPDAVSEFIETMGLRYISFKPGSTTAVDKVIEIAKQYPDFPIGLQWTGGRAGGHHSFEDFHSPLLSRYAQIRSCRNIVLIAGSGFGGAEDSFPYLTGDWSVSCGYPPMPLDGVLFGSRMMVSKEAHTSSEAKNLIIEADGTDDEQWWRSYDGPVGGVVTVKSEMGEPIHLLATRGVMLWKELDEKVFSVMDGQKRMQYLREHHDEIVSRLNKDFAKPWFAVNTQGQAVEIEDLTYHETMRRLCFLLYVRGEGRWIDHSYHRLIRDFFLLVAERFNEPIDEPAGDADSIMQQFEMHIGHKAHEILYPEDVAHLIALFRRRGQKPVPFVPRLDEQFETWFKKDSLWQSEDIDAVVDRDVQRICIIHGPVAARHSVCLTECAATVLDSICQQHIELLSSSDVVIQDRKREHMDVESPIDLANFPGLHVTETTELKRYEFSDKGALPKIAILFEHIAGQNPWLQAALLVDRTFTQHSWKLNPIRAAFTPSVGDALEVHLSSDGLPQAMTLLSNSGNRSLHRRKVVQIALQEDDLVSISLSPQALGLVLPVGQFTYLLHTDGAGYRLYERYENRHEQMKTLYHRLWIGEESRPQRHMGLNSEFSGSEVLLTEQAIRQFEDVIRRVSPTQITNWAPEMPIPLDYCVVVAWAALVKPLVLTDIDCDLLRLLHQSVDISYNDAAELLFTGDTVHSVARITGLTSMTSGKQVEVSAEIFRGSESVVNIKSCFFIRETMGRDSRSFKSTQEPEMIFEVDSEVRQALLLSRNWLQFIKHPKTLLGSKILFQLATHTTYEQGSAASSIQVTGSVFTLSQSEQLAHIGHVYLEEDGTVGNIVVDFLLRHGSLRNPRQSLEYPGWMLDSTAHFKAPVRSASYAAVSKDPNPIHLCLAFARFAGLAHTVVHGMHTSAIVRRMVEHTVGDISRSRVRRWKADFQDVVLPGDSLRVEFQHIAMEYGRMILRVQAINDRSGSRVMDAEATVEQAPTAYMFCGQGSQEKGMGMKLYSTESAVQALWDKGDSFFKQHFGFSLLHIVRENPTELTVSFGGKRGRRVRDRYLAMTRKQNSFQGHGDETCIVPDLTRTSISHTFAHPDGLLFSTQFSQPALALMEMAEYEHLKAKGVMQHGSPFAGHSLGEYAALGACTSFMQLDDLLELIFYRGLKMQNALERDAGGRTDYSMMAVDPTRVGKAFGEQDLQSLVEFISRESNVLLEVVNYNVASRQYVCAGHFRALYILGKVLDGIAAAKERSLPPAEQIHLLVQVQSGAAQALKNDVVLERGKATVPLSGIDIPFHSTMLRSEIEHYRNYLSQKVQVGDVRPKQLEGRWIPNVTGKAFSIERKYVEEVQRVTGSEPLQHLLTSMA